MTAIIGPRLKQQTLTEQLLCVIPWGYISKYSYKDPFEETYIRGATKQAKQRYKLKQSFRQNYMKEQGRKRFIPK